MQYLGELGADVKVFRNDEIAAADIAAMGPKGIVISPGPCTPTEAGISLAVVRELLPAGSDTGRVPRSPGDRPGLRRRGRACG